MNGIRKIILIEVTRKTNMVCSHSHMNINCKVKDSHSYNPERHMELPGKGNRGALLGGLGADGHRNLQDPVEGGWKGNS